MIKKLPLIFVALIALSSCQSNTDPAIPSAAKKDSNTAADSCIVASTPCEANFQPNAAVSEVIVLYRSSDLQSPNATITKLVVAIHGIGRNPKSIFNEMMTAFKNTNKLDSTLVIAPHFFANVDHPEETFLYWTKDGWSAGDDSLNDVGVSSFDVIDSLVSSVLSNGNFPNINEVIITGLSAGGQFTERYGAGNSIEPKFPKVHFRYIIASPSSYMYFDNTRWVDGTSYQFATPAETTCDYNVYKYGLDQRNRYMSEKPSSSLITDFGSRDVVLIAGDQDNATAAPIPPIPNDPKDGADLDVSCAAKLQGISRYQRAQIFKAYMDRLFPQVHHPFVTGKGIAHQDVLYEDPDALSWLTD